MAFTSERSPSGYLRWHDRPLASKTMEHFRTLGLSQDNLGLLGKLVAGHARFLLIGGAAVRVYIGSRRKPEDMDLLIEAEIDNAKRVHSLLRECGVTTIFSAEHLTKSNQQIRLTENVYDYKADLVTPSSDFDFQAEFARAKVITIAGSQVRVICRESLIAMKSRTGRKWDVRDLELLMNVQRREERHKGGNP